MKTIDIHNARKRIECAIINIQKRFSEDNAKTACRFLDRWRLDNKSHVRIANYAECIRRILEIKDDKKSRTGQKKTSNKSTKQLLMLITQTRSKKILFWR
ncbi:MAG: hypothetical protein QW177_09110 [Candidatus Nitrosotenuis sp.]